MIKERRVTPGLRISIVVWLSVLSSPLAAPAQDESPSEDRVGGAYLNEQLAAYDALKHARDLCRAEAWDDAVHAYQNLLEKFSHTILRADPPASTVTAPRDMEYFVGLPEAVFLDFATQPARLLDTYQGRFETVAERALSASASDDAAHRRDIIRHFPTTAAAAALEHLIDRDVESGRLASARQYLHLLITRHPERGSRRWRWRAKYALANAWCGNDAPLKRLMDELRALPQSPEVAWGGGREPIAEFLTRNAADQPPRSAFNTQGGPAQPLPLGGVVRSVAPEARLWRFADFQPITARYRRMSAAQQRTPLRSDHADPAAGRYVGLMPIVHQGRLFVGDSSNVWAFDPDAPHEPLWQFRRLEPLDEDASDDPWLLREQAPSLYTLSAAGESVFAYLDDAEGGTPNANEKNAGSLLALDAADGRVRWRNDLSALAGPFDECRLDGAPIVVDDETLVAIARRRKPFGFETCLLIGLDPRTGRLKWRSHVGEAATGGYGYHRPTRTFPAADGHRVFVFSNMGTIAAAYAADGRIVWLWRYASSFGDAAAGFWSDADAGQYAPWRYNATIVWRDRIIVAPLDTDAVFVLSQDDGRLVNIIPTERIHEPESILGVVDDKLYAIGRKVVCYDLIADGIAWQRQLPEGRLRGRGAVTSDGVLVPTDVALFRYPLAGGAPRSYHWASEDAGNVLPLDNQIIVAGAATLIGLVEKESALTRLKSRLDAAPNDPGPALTLAELAFQIGEFARGLEAIDAALERAGGVALLQDDAVKDRAFRLCLDAADAVMKRGRRESNGNASDARLALEALDRAALCAPDADARVQYVLKRSDVYVATEAFARAVESFQMLLSDVGLAVQLMPAGQPRQSVGAFARAQIDRLVFEQGRDIYESIERRAHDQLR
ncbi:MAG: PQQ-binding-like beta-propeller repeat protein, partial [Phycisphaerae bacterium]